MLLPSVMLSSLQSRCFTYIMLPYHCHATLPTSYYSAPAMCCLYDTVISLYQHAVTLLPIHLPLAHGYPLVMGLTWLSSIAFILCLPSPRGLRVHAKNYSLSTLRWALIKNSCDGSAQRPYRACFTNSTCSERCYISAHTTDWPEYSSALIICLLCLCCSEIVM